MTLDSRCYYTFVMTSRSLPTSRKFGINLATAALEVNTARLGEKRLFIDIG